MRVGLRSREHLSRAQVYPVSAEEVSQMLQMPLPPAYQEVLVPFCEEEVRDKTKTKGASPPVESTPVRKYNGVPKQTGHKKPGRDNTVRSAERVSEMSTALVAQRDAARSPRLEEAESGMELAPICTVKLHEGRALILP